jgi:hypothetical protein
MKTQTEKALRLLSSPRGQYIMGQALFIAIEQLNKVESPHKEESNISDMTFLMENLFPLYAKIVGVKQ